jgi:hypothetical protein
MSTADKRATHLVSDLDPDMPRNRRRGRVRFFAWLAALAILSRVGFGLPSGTSRGVAIVALLFVFVGGIVVWLANASIRLSSSGREMKDWGKW